MLLQPRRDRPFERPPISSQAIAERIGRCLLVRAKRLLIHAIRSVRPPGAGAGGKQAGRCGPPDAGEAKRVNPMMARIGRLLAGKSRRGSHAVRISACAAGTMFERETSRVIPWREGARRVPPSLRRAFAARFLLPATVGGGRHTLRISA